MRKLTMVAVVMAAFCSTAKATVIDDMGRFAVRTIFYNLNCARVSSLLLTTARAVASGMSDEEYNYRTMELVIDVAGLGGNKAFCALFAPIMLKNEKLIQAH
jgi:hypothetical protein